MANDSDSTIERGSYGDRGNLEQGRPDGHGKPGGGSDESGVKTTQTTYDYSQRPKPRK
jgi:hypothetical protein